MRNKPAIITYRYERFGGILHLARPPALVWVDKDYMRALGYPPSPPWDEPDDGILSAPTEAHLSLTNQCRAGCVGCYTGSYHPDSPPPEAADELGFEGHRDALDALAAVRVFHVALGGGESMELPWLFDLAAHARRVGIVPNLTTNGFLVDEKSAAACRVFGQINVSIDGLGPDYRRARGIDGFSRADRALRLLRRARNKCGINTVLTRHNFDALESVVKYARRVGANQIEILRFKPAGRGADRFADLDLTPEQARAFYPLVQRLARRHRVNLRLDCSLLPFVFFHQPDRERAEFFSVNGCYGGNLLIGVRPDGKASACSFAPSEGRDVRKIAHWWRDPGVFRDFRLWGETAPAPCDTCAYVRLCAGGCHAVAAHVTGDLRATDPGCPLEKAEYNPGPSDR